MKKYWIKTKRTYVSNGEEKSMFISVGSLVHFPESGDKREGFSLELPMYPDTKFYVFEQEERAPQQNTARPTQSVDYPQESSSDYDTPF